MLDVVVDGAQRRRLLPDALHHDVGRRTPQRIIAARLRTGVGHPVGHENADLIREKIPSLG